GFGIKHLFLSSQDSVLRIEKAYLKPLLPAQELAQSLAYQSIISAGELPLLIARKVNFEKMIYQQMFRLGSLHLYSPQYEAFLDATKPKQQGQEFRNFEQMLRSIPLDIQADTLAVHSAKVSYRSLQKTRNVQVEYDSVPRIATHSLEKLDFTVLKIDLGRALHESAIEHIDTKKLSLTAQGYTYTNAEGAYTLKAKTVEASAHKRLISVSGLTLLPTAENARNGKINLYVPQMRGEGIDFVSFMLKQQMDWDKLVVENAQVQIFTTEHTRKKDRFLKKFELENALQTMPAFVRVDTLQLKGATFTLEEADRQGQPKARHQVENVEVQLLDIGLGRATHYTLDSLPIFWNEASLAFALKKYTYEAQGLTYKFALQNIQKNAFAQQWHIDALSWKSALTVAQYREKFPTRKWLAEGGLGSITLDIPNLEEIIFHRNLAIQRAVIQTPKLKFWVFDALSPIIKNDSTKAWWADLQQDVPLQFSIDTLSMQNAEVECLEAQNRWTQKTKLALGISKLEWDTKLSWKNAGITGEAYTFSLPASQSALHIQQWQLNLEPAPHFKANGVRFAWKQSNVVADSSFVEVESASAYLPLIELGKPLKLNDLKVEKGKGVLYFAPTTQPKASTALPTFAQKPFVLLADTLRAKDIDLTIYQKTAKQTFLHTFILEEGSLEQLHWKLQANSNPETAHFTFKIRQYETRIRQGLYQVKARNLQWSSKPNLLIIKQLSILPTVSAKVLNRLQTHQKELLETRIKEVQARGIDIEAFLQDRSVHVQRLSLDSVLLHLSADRRLPTIAKKRRMPAEQLRGLRLPLAIDTLDTQKLSL
ncbi:MAG: hypothetical protein EAZ95_18440, partial [Bacteroidetes bacterium]